MNLSPKFLPIFAVLAFSCSKQSGISPIAVQKNNDNKFLQFLTCDPTDKISPKILTTEKQDASVLARFLDNPKASFTLKSPELKIFSKELKTILQMIEYRADIYLESSLRWENDGKEIANINIILESISPVRKILKDIEESDFSEIAIESKLVINALQKISKDLQKKQAAFPELLPEGVDLAYALILGSIPGQDRNSAGRAGFLYRTYLKKLFNEHLKDDFYTAIREGFFVNRANALAIFSNLSPVYRKFLQREVEMLSENSEQAGAEKQMLQSILRSEKFSLSPHDPNIAKLKAQFGQNIYVQGLARGSVAKTYLISCRNQGQDKHFVAKTGVYRKTELVKSLDEELNELDAFELTEIYPDVAVKGDRPGYDLDPEAHQKKQKAFELVVRNNVKNAILEDVDFEKEARHLEILAQSYRECPGVKIVAGGFKVIENTDFLFMEYADGVVLSDIKELDQKSAFKLNETLKELYAQIVLGQEKAFHPDTHAGNIIFDGQSFTLIDAGRIALLNQDELQEIQGFEHALSALRTIPQQGLAGRIWDEGQFKDLERQLLIHGYSYGRTGYGFFSPLRAIFAMKKDDPRSLREYLIWTISNWRHNETAALRSINMIQKLYEHYVKKHGFDGDYYGHYRTAMNLAKI